MKNKRGSTGYRGAVLLRLASVLLILVLLSTSVLSGIYARYTTSMVGGDSARVAKFEVTEAGELLSFFTADIQPGGSISKSVTVENKSEVSISYIITPTSRYSNLPLEFSASGCAVLLPGQSDTYTLTVTWPAGKNSTDYCGMVELIQLTLEASQVD